MYTAFPNFPNNLNHNPKFERAVQWMLLVCTVAIVLSYCSSCYTPAKAKRQALRAMTQHPEEVLPTLRQLAPCITVTVDTFYTTVDTTITVDCPDTSAAQYFTVHDTITRTERRTVKVPYPVTLPTRTVVRYIKDSAEVMECNLRNARLTTEREQAIQREQYTAAKLGKARSTRNWLWMALLACVLIGTRKAWLPVVGRMVNPIK